jgi:hypothetical protein
MAYTTEANVEAYLGEAFDETTTPSTSDLTIFIGWADKLIEDYTGTAFESTAVTEEILDSEGHTRFKLPKRPIISVTTFEVDKAGLGSSSSPDWEARTEGRTNSEDFVILEDEGILHFHNDIPSVGIQNVRITYNYGYSTVPKDVERLATLLVVKEILKARLADNLYSSQDSISVGPINISKAGTQSTSSVRELDRDIEEAWKAVGKFKTVLH